MKKKVISLLLMSLILFSFVPMSAVADSEFSADTKSVLFMSTPHTHGTGADAIVFQQWDDSTNIPTDPGNYYLTNDVTLDATWTVPEGEETNLCLNSHVIKLADDKTGSIIKVPQNATLNLYDCNATTKHYFTKDMSGLWTLASDQTTPTDYFVTGGVITGGNSDSDGGGIMISGGTFNMYGGCIVGNTADGKGGGVYNNGGTFTMTDGCINGNTAEKGGGVYVTFLSVNILTGGTVTDNTATDGGSGLYVQEELCFAAGTFITMADGSRKPIETLEIGDLVRVFDHENGEISTSKLFDVWKYPEKHSDVVTLHFSHDIDVTVVYGHSFFDREKNKYVSVSADNVGSFVGHEFYNVDEARWETLIGYEFLDGAVDTYVITSEKHLNCVANGMLTNEDGFYTMLTNIFEYGDGLKIDAAKKASNIEKYGLFSFDKLKYASRETYDMLNLQYLNVAFGKSMITPETFACMEAFWTGVDPELFVDPEEDEEPEATKPLLRKMLLGSASLVPAPTAPGIYIGGSIRITGNDSENLYLASGKAVTIGTGTASGGNGVAAPTDDFKVGITTATAPTVDSQVQFTTNGTADDTSYFTSDNDAYEVKFNTDHLALAVKTTPSHTHAFTYTASNGKLTATCIEGCDKGYNTNPLTLTLTAPASLVYDGNAKSFTFADGEAAAWTGAGLELPTICYYQEDGSSVKRLESAPTDAGESYMAEIGVNNKYAQVFFSVAKAKQVVTIIGDISKVYDMNFVYFNIHSKDLLVYFGDGAVTVEYKLATEPDTAYTTTAPINAGNYVVRVSVAEGTNYPAGVATKEFTISKANISRVGFNDVAQPVATETATAKVSGIAIGAKYVGTITWSPALEEEKFGYDTVYTVSIALEITSAYKDNYKFTDNVKLIKPTEGWVKSSDSSETKLIYTKTFEKTEKAPHVHNLVKVDGRPATNIAGWKDYYECKDSEDACHVYFEDENGTKLIENLTEWKAEGGNGYIAPIQKRCCRCDKCGFWHTNCCLGKVFCLKVRIVKYIIIFFINLFLGCC